MSIMIPSEILTTSRKVPAGEKRLFELLKRLSDDYLVFHSLNWLQIENRRKNHRGWLQKDEGEADFVIFHKELGMLVLEVKDGAISLSEGKWFQQNRFNGKTVVTDPIQQAKFSQYRLINLLKQTSSVSCFVGSVVCFESISKTNIKGDFPPNYHNDIVLFSEDLIDAKTLVAAIERAFSFYKNTTAYYYHNPMESDMKDIIAAFAPELGLYQNIDSTTEYFKRMTYEQFKILDVAESVNTMAIVGIAGSGKTMIAQELACRLSVDAPVLFLCFNRFLADQLRRNFIDCSAVDVASLISLSGAKQTEGNLDGFITQFLLSWVKNQEKYSAIIIDEAQDFNPTHLKLLQQAMEEKDGKFYAFYDKEQLVQGTQSQDSIQAFHNWGNSFESRLTLTQNCRNSKEIALTSTRPLGIEEKKISVLREDEQGRFKEPIVFYANSSALTANILKKLIYKHMESGVAQKDITVLTCKTIETSILEEKHYGIASDIQLKTTKSANSILFSTVRKFKGLESEVVILLDVSKELFEGLDKGRNLFYIGASRAMSVLDIILADSTNHATIAYADKEVLLHEYLRAQKGLNENLRAEQSEKETKNG